MLRQDFMGLYRDKVIQCCDIVGQARTIFISIEDF